MPLARLKYSFLSRRIGRKVSIMTKLLLYLVLFGVTVSCGRDEYAQVKVGGPGRIAGDDPINRYTVMVKLFVSRGGRVRPGSCSGTLLDPRHVLLAAHCVNNVWRAKVLVGYDSKVLLGNGEEFSAVGEGGAFVVNKSYLSRGVIRMLMVTFSKMAFLPLTVKMVDLAIIKLKKPLDLPYPIGYKIPENGDDDLTNKKVIIAGYGIGDMGQTPFKARKSEIKVARDFKKSDLLEFTNFFNRMNFGDSGGPVWWYDEQGKLNLVGVHSFLTTWFRFYTYSIDIRHHRQWIKDAMRVLQERDPLLSKKMDMSKRYFAGSMEDFYKDHTYSD